jgi:hypothetical protein
MENELPGLSYDICPFCGQNAEIDIEKTDLKTIVFFCVHCKAEGTARRYALEESQPVWTPPKDVETYREAPAGNIQIRAGFDRRTGLCWVRLSGPKDELLPAVEAREDVLERVRSLLEPHLEEAF